MCRKSNYSPNGEELTEEQTTSSTKPPTRCRKCCKCIMQMTKRYILPTLLLLGVSVGGAYMFEKLEGQNERDAIVDLQYRRAEMLQRLWNESQMGNYNASAWQTLADTLFQSYENQRIQRLQPVFPIGGDVENQLWTFWGALLYCGTIYTTIGYGLIAPKTVAGRAATIGYATIGIPVCMIFLNNLGKLMALALRKLHWLTWRIFHYAGKAGTMAGQMAEQVAGQAAGQVATLLQKSRSKESNVNSETSGDGDAASQQSDGLPGRKSGAHSTSTLDVRSIEEQVVNDPNAEVLVANEEDFSPSPIFPIAVLILYIFAGAWMYHSWETWDYFESSYFIFVSLSTIGLGDVTPSHPKFFIASSIYILFGLTLVSFVINTILLQAKKTIAQAKKAPGAIISMGKRYKDNRGSKSSLKISDSYNKADV